MKSIRFRILVAAMAVLMGTVIAQSQSADAPPMHTHGAEFGFGGHMLKFFTEYLNLTDTQQAQIKTTMQKEHATLKPLLQQMHQAEAQLKQYEEGAYDEAKVRAVAAQQSQTMVELMVQKARIHNELFQMLTADQQSKLKEFEAQREARRAQHMHPKDGSPDAQDE